MVWPLLVALQIPFMGIDIREGFVVSGVTEAGRNPAPQDWLVDEMIHTGHVGLSNPHLKWTKASADKDGWFNDVAGGYVYAQAVLQEPMNVILVATGDSMVYVNGEPRGGDPYGYGYVQLPLRLNKGVNTFIFGGGRGRVKASLVPVHSGQQLATGDLTLPDVLATDKGRLFGSVVVVNNTDHDATGLVLDAVVGKHSVTTALPPIPPLSIRKCRFDFAVPTADSNLILKLKNGDKLYDQGQATLQVKKEGQAYKRTFISQIDGSVQYYGVTPALVPSPKNSLVLTLHGASVEGVGQAAAYAAKDDIVLVAPTNRRPYGFDWEDWGRMDAMEVLDIAKAAFPHDPLKVFLTGHSMGGHGTWSIGTMYPDTFGSIAPSAGWVSFWSYAGGWDPVGPTPAETVIRSSMNASDTMMRARNLANQGVYILHGDKDDNVPVEEARGMRDFLAPWHPALGYHEEPGAGHWWGNQCVDYPEIFAMFAKHPRIEHPAAFTFITPNPAISSRFDWLTITELDKYGTPGRAEFREGQLQTTNVAGLSIGREFDHLTIDGQSFEHLRPGPMVRTGGTWKPGRLAGGKSPERGGPLKNALQRRFVLVYGTHGTRDENDWAHSKARFDAENWYYRGNGSVDVVADRDAKAIVGGRNVVLYGNARTNSAIPELVGTLPSEIVARGDQGMMAVLPQKDGAGLAAIIGGESLVGMRTTDRLPIFVSGVAYPDWVILGDDIAARGTKAVVAAGFFDNAWRYDPSQSGARP